MYTGLYFPFYYLLNITSVASAIQGTVDDVGLNIAFQIVHPGLKFSVNCTAVSPDKKSIYSVEWKFPNSIGVFWANLGPNKEIYQEFFRRHPYKPSSLRTLQRVRT